MTRAGAMEMMGQLSLVLANSIDIIVLNHKQRMNWGRTNLSSQAGNAMVVAKRCSNFFCVISSTNDRCVSVQEGEGGVQCVRCQFESLWDVYC